MLSKLLFPQDLPTWALFFELILAAAIVIFAGRRLAQLADTLADRLNLGGGWVGLILMATVTSLPEVITSGTATAIGNVDLAFGGILGSCSFNVTLIVLLNALMGGGSILRGVSASHTLTSSFGLWLIGLALIGIVLAEKFAHTPAIARLFELGWAVLILISYLGCMRLVYQFEKKTNRTDGAPNNRSSVRDLYGPLAVLAIIIIGASWWLAQLGDTLSTHKIDMLGRPLGATFVGAGFLALATSLPEITTSIAAVRLGNLDLALGNIFGSNMFNIVVIPMLKAISLIKGDGLLMAAGSVNSTPNLIVGLLAILLTAIAMGGLTYQSSRKMLRRFGFDSILIAVVYAGGMVLLLVEASP